MKSIINRCRSVIKNYLRELLDIPPNYVGDNGCLRAAASFATWNQVPGDYIEFGVWNGYSFGVAYREIIRQRAQHLSLGYSSPEYDSWAARRPRFFAFDSFEGIPDDSGVERMVDYEAGSYAATEHDFTNSIKAKGVDLSDVVLVKGWYEDTCTAETKREHGLDRVAVAFIDCDLYESTVPVLDFLTELVQQGTILIFDDWFRFRGDPHSGEQRACREWLERNPQIELIEFWRQAPQAVSFIVNLKD